MTDRTRDAAAAPAPTVLLTVSGEVPADLDELIHRGRRPRADYVEMAAAFGGADLLDRVAARRATGRVGRLLERLAGPDVVTAWACHRLRRRYDVIVTDGEQVGLPFALLCRLTGRRHARHVMIVHVLSTPAKQVPTRLLGLQRHIDTFVTYASSQSDFVRRRLRVPAERIAQTPFMVDTRFFHPGVERRATRPTICAVGLERRDYPTLIAAVRELDARVVIAAASPWSKQADSTEGTDLPANVEVCRLGPVDLRQLYADAELLVMPLHDVDFQAGVTALLEAMAMGRAVVCSRTTGQTDVVEQGVTGLYVPPRDPEALRGAIQHLLDDPALAARMGRAARRVAVEELDVERYAARLAAIVAQSTGQGTARNSSRPGSPHSVRRHPAAGDPALATRQVPRPITEVAGR